MSMMLYNSADEGTQAIRRENYLNCYYDLNVHKILAFIWKPNLLGFNAYFFLVLIEWHRSVKTKTTTTTTTTREGRTRESEIQDEENKNK